MPEFKIRDLMIDVIAQDMDLHCRLLGTCEFQAISKIPNLCQRILTTCFRLCSVVTCRFVFTPLPTCRYIITPIYVACEGGSKPEPPDTTIIVIEDTIRYVADQTQIVVDVGALVINPGNIDKVRAQLNAVLDNAGKVASTKAGDIQKEASELADTLSKAVDQLRSLKK